MMKEFRAEDPSQNQTSDPCILTRFRHSVIKYK